MALFIPRTDIRVKIQNQAPHQFYFDCRWFCFGSESFFNLGIEIFPTIIPHYFFICF
ncbi:hypothetical protein HMPREF0794_2323 [Staphylococcus epidermidis M23864:W2(grey)]|nr:hypothetical protein HMPREF0794_2323 [Staphylococcus epidermidis M23864:W2(grey)]